MYYGGGPECAKIWEHLKILDENYANNIENICAKDLLSDSLGLTVIFPNQSFRDDLDKLINKQDLSMEDITRARRMIQNTVNKKNLPHPSQFMEFKHSLPLRSGLTIKPVSSTDDEVTLESGIVLTKDKKFKSPKIYNYSVWRVSKVINFFNDQLRNCHSNT